MPVYGLLRFTDWRVVLAAFGSNPLPQTQALIDLAHS